MVNAVEKRRYGQQLHNFYCAWQPESVVVPGMFRGHFAQEEDDPKTFQLEVTFVRMDKCATLSLREALSIMAATGKPEKLTQKIKLNDDLYDVPVTKHNIKASESVSMQIIIDQHSDLVQLSPEQIKQANNLSPLSPIQIPNQIGSMIVLKPNLYLKQTVIQCFS